MILNDFLKALRQLPDPRFFSVLAMGIALTIGLLLGLYWVLTLFIGWILPDTFWLPWIGEIGGLSTALSWAALPVVGLASIFLMVPVASAFQGLFLDQIAEAVEAKYYPHLPPTRPANLTESLVDAGKSLALMFSVNLAALLLYLLFAPVAPLVFWGVNGILLGREYAQSVALRRLPPEQARRFRQRHRVEVFAAGVLMAALLTLPVVNLLVPILGVATFTHLYHRLTQAPPDKITATRPRNR